MTDVPPIEDLPIEETAHLKPRFDRDGLVTAIAVDGVTGEVLMLAHMNAEALASTVETGIAHYWSRSRQALWRKGDTSGQTQHVLEMRVDCDQDAILLKVQVGGDGGACHTGRRTCFYRVVSLADGVPRLTVADDTERSTPRMTAAAGIRSTHDGDSAALSSSARPSGRGKRTQKP